MNVRLFIYVLIPACIGEGTLVVAPAQELASPQALPAAEARHDTLSRNVRCTLHQDPAGWWFVSPQGKPFFSLGVCMFNQGTDKEDFNPAKPSYAVLRHYDTPEAWAKANVPRLRSWGFTTAGGWSDYETLKSAAGSELWMTPVLNLGATDRRTLVRYVGRKGRPTHRGACGIIPCPAARRPSSDRPLQRQ